MFKNTKSKVYYFIYFFTFLAILPMPRNLQYVASIFKLGSSTFSLRKISNPFFNAFLIASYFCNFTLLASRSFSFDCKSFSLFFFQVEKVILGTPKIEATSLQEVPLSSFWELSTWFLKIYLNVGALLQKWSLCLMSNVDFCQMKVNNFNIIRKLYFTFDLTFHLVKTLHTRFFSTVSLFIPYYLIVRINKRKYA